MRTFARTAALVIIGVILLVFAIVNRQVVTFSLDPLGSLDPANTLVFSAPLFVLAIVLLAIGIIVGGVMMWFRQGKWRRLARENEARARELRAENERLSREMQALVAAPGLAPGQPVLTIAKSA